MTIYVDLDGVLADYDKAANAALRTDNHYKFEFIWGAEAYWKRLHAQGNFFASLERMPDARMLWAALCRIDLASSPVILTALPKTGAESVDKQKRQWVKDQIQHDAPVITCKTVEKPDYCKPGDILIDDRAVNRAAWMHKGGTYIIHTDVERTIGTLKALGIIV